MKDYVVYVQRSASFSEDEINKVYEGLIKVMPIERILFKSSGYIEVYTEWFDLFDQQVEDVVSNFIEKAITVVESDIKQDIISIQSFEERLINRKAKLKELVELRG